jgi:hypothetical protein
MIENIGLYSFLENDDVYVVVTKNECPIEWEKLKKIDGWEVESEDNFYIMGTDARAELECIGSEKLLVFKSNDTIFFKCPISSEIIDYFTSFGTTGFYLIQSEILLNKEDVYQKFTEGEIDGLICCFYTDDKKKEIFDLDENGSILCLKT